MKYTTNPQKTYYNKTGAGGIIYGRVDKRKDATPEELAKIIIATKKYRRYNGGDDGGWRCDVSTARSTDIYDFVYSESLYIWGTKNEHRKLEKLLKPYMKVFPREYEDEEKSCDDCGFCIAEENFCKWDSHINTEYVLRTWKK